MKKCLLSIAIIACLASCKKEKATLSSDLWGKWDLAFVHGGLRPPMAVTNSGNMYQFGSDSTYVKYLDNKIAASGKFSIRIIETSDTVKFGSITFTNPTYTDAWAQTPHTIVVGSSASDGPSYEYHKVSNQ